MAEFFWNGSLDAASNSTNEEDIEIYAKTASHLANLLSVRGDYENALNIAVPVANRLEKLQCDTISDYINLLIYIGCCQAGLGQGGESTTDGFDRAYKKHLDNIEKNHTDESYKNAIAGLINIAYICNYTKNYREALNWIAKFGELLGEYEQRPNTDGDYVDKQVARFAIYKAIALDGLGMKEEATKVYDEYLETDYSKTPEGKLNANEYLTKVNRWEEAADNYSSLDIMLARNKAYSLEDIRDLLVKKYQANLKAGRRDSAAMVSLQISDALDKAFAQAKQIDEQEQSTIVKIVGEMTANNEKVERMKIYGLLGILGLAILVFLCILLYRRIALQRLRKQYKNLEESCRLVEEDTADKERTATEHRITQAIQQKMVPEALPQYKGLGLYATMTPSAGICGDLYDCMIREDKLIFCIGNPVAEDTHSSVMAGMVWALFRSAAMHEETPQNIVTDINNALTKNGEIDMGVTLFVGVLDLKTGMLNYCNAGHGTALLLHEEVNLLPVGENPPLGVQVNWDFVEQEVEMVKGSLLFLYTSGLALATNGKQKQYGEKMVHGAALQAMKMNASPKPFIENVQQTIDKFIDGTPQTRDMTMLVIKRL
jgi:serine phosphatase RsbU (regulator of sigma subunit)